MIPKFQYVVKVNDSTFAFQNFHHIIVSFRVTHTHTKSKYIIHSLRERVKTERNLNILAKKAKKIPLYKVYEYDPILFRVKNIHSFVVKNKENISSKYFQSENCNSRPYVRQQTIIPK